MRRLPFVFSLLSVVAGCYGAPPDVEGTPCSADVACPPNYVCQEGGCVSSPGAPGPAATSTSRGTTGSGMTGGSTHPQAVTVTTNTGTIGFSSSGFNDATGPVTGTNGGPGTVGFTGTTGGPVGFTATGTVGASTTTGGFLGICSSCVNNADCASGYCNFATFTPEGYCDAFECSNDPAACGPFGCQGFGCGCPVMTNTGTIGGPTAVATSTSGTTGQLSDECDSCAATGTCPGSGTCYSISLDGGDFCLDSCTSNTQCPVNAPCDTQYDVCLPTNGSCVGYVASPYPICGSCTNNAQCQSGYCNLSQGVPGFCDALESCFQNPTVCEPYFCSQSPTQNCSCNIITDTAAGPTSSGTTGVTIGTVGFGSTTGGASTIGAGSTTGGLGFCEACSAASQCESGCCDDATGMTCSATQGFCDDAQFCTSPSQCGGFPCNNGVCCGGIVIVANGSSTSGVTTAAASSSTGGTGSCVGPGVQSNTDCGGSHEVCGSGQTCGSYTTLFGTSFYACGCTSSQNGGVDSCRVANDVPGGNGLVVCDSSTLTCRQPRDMEPAFANAPSPVEYCAPGYGAVQPSSDGGIFATVCAQGCLSNSDCTANFTLCEAGSLSVYQADADAGSTSIEFFPSHCGYNLCGPIIQDFDAGYYQPCNSQSVNDGTCQPIAINGAYVGLCFRNGMITTTGACSGTLGQASETCVAGDICLPENEPVDACSPQQTTYCLPACNANSPTEAPITPTCPTIFGFQTSCQTYPNDPRGNPLAAGVCY